MNTSILNDKAYIEKVKLLLSKSQDAYKNISKQLIWEMCKIRIKEFTISYCKQKRKIKNNLIGDLENKVQAKEKELIDSNYKHSIQAQRDLLAHDLHNLIEEKNKGAYIRSRAKWVEEGEKVQSSF